MYGVWSTLSLFSAIHFYTVSSTNQPWVVACTVHVQYLPYHSNRRRPTVPVFLPASKRYFNPRSTKNSLGGSDWDVATTIFSGSTSASKQFQSGHCNSCSIQVDKPHLSSYHRIAVRPSVHTTSTTHDARYSTHTTPPTPITLSPIHHPPPPPPRPQALPVLVCSLDKILGLLFEIPTYRTGCWLGGHTTQPRPAATPRPSSNIDSLLAQPQPPCRLFSTMPTRRS